MTKKLKNTQRKKGTPPTQLQITNIFARFQLFGHIVERILQTNTIQLYLVPEAVWGTGRQSDTNWELFLA